MSKPEPNVEDLAREVAAKHELLELRLTAATALHVAGLMQLVNRHPGLSPGSRSTAAFVVEHIRAYFADCPTAIAVLLKGDDPNEDRPM